MTTLGYVALDWLRQLPAPGDPSKPLVLVDWQADFVCDWLALDPAGKFIYRRGALSEPKGKGKSPLAAALALFELAGPCRFGGWDSRGEPIGRLWGQDGDPPPLVQVCGVSEESADSNVYSLAHELLTVADGRAAEVLGVDVGRLRLYLNGRPGKCEAVTSSAGAREGQRVTFAVLDESHLWTPSNGGVRLAKVVRRNVGKTGGRSIEFSNAPELGIESVAEETAAQFASGSPGLLYVASQASTVPHPEASDDELLMILDELYAGSPWIDTHRILAEVRDSATGWDESLRYFFNIAQPGGTAAVDPRTWASLSLRGFKPEKGAVILGAGFDGGDTRDATAIVCVAAGPDGRQHVFPWQIWERPTNVKDWRVPRHEVHQSVERLFSDYDVAALYCDPWQWRSEVEQWAGEYGEDHVVEFPTNSRVRFGPALDRFLTAIIEEQVTHSGDPVLTRHVLNAQLRTSGAWHVLQKGGPSRHIDAAVAAVLALEAASTYQAPVEREPLIAWI